ncbi:MAG TPA: DUF4270 family protein, partial [Flavobacteriaceae bacterium]|nr:DUF4270 family protein [Flavobacteriaceae bacterium]
MKLKQFSIRIGLLATMVVAFIACDKDYNTIGTDILADQNFSTGSVKFPVVAYTKALKPVRSNNLTTALLGVYNDPVYGVTSASVVSQLIPTTFKPSFGEDTKIDSIFLTIPYFSHKTGEIEDGRSVYKLDSVFGENPIKISVYQNNYFLRDYNPETNLTELQEYYSNSNETINFDNHIGELLYQSEEFVPNPTEIVLTKFNEDTEENEESERLAPSIRVPLSAPIEDEDPDYSFWEELLFFNQDEYSYLSNANNFKEYFRGIYIKAEPVNNDGNMLMFNLGSASANITVYYSYFVQTIVDEEGNETEERNNSVFRMNLTGNSINIIDNNFAIPNNGDEEN